MLGFEHDLIMHGLLRRDVDGTDRVVRAHGVRIAENIASLVDKRGNDESKPAALFLPLPSAQRPL